MSQAGPGTGRRGQPLWALGGLLLGWIALRAMFIDLPTAKPHSPGEMARTIAGLAQTSAPRPRMVQAGTINPPLDSMTSAWNRPLAPGPVRARGYRAPVPLAPVAVSQALSEPAFQAQRAAGYSSLRMATMAATPQPHEVPAGPAAARSPAPPATSGGALDAPRAPRWSGDGWLLWRPGSSGLASAGVAAPVYGASQAGAVLRYALAPGSRHRPAVFVRGVTALGSVRESDLAAGLAVRPLAGLPVVAHAEARLSRRRSVIELRPAAFVSTGMEAAPVAGGITARGYAQAGYVGGPGATGFADGSLILEKKLWRARDSALAAGAGAWGGAQRGAARLDLGPTASLRFRMGETRARLSADYRLRIAGNAEPAAGAALTLSAGF